jgi:hypothetical protein
MEAFYQRLLSADKSDQRDHFSIGHFDHEPLGELEIWA